MPFLKNFCFKTKEKERKEKRLEINRLGAQKK